jgi:two-component system response regulator AtoC
MLATLLIVDDEKNTREGLRRSFEDEFDVYTAADQAGALEVLKSDHIDVLITDLKLGGDNGMKLIEAALKLPRPPICLMMTAYGSVETAVEAMRRGAYDFVTKPLNIDDLEIRVRRALKSRQTEEEVVVLRKAVDKRYGIENILGHSAVMEEVFDTIRQVAPSRATVLILGPSGTGKELAAKAIHQLSPRANRRFVAVHCAALSPQLLESELFGHEKGAFTGATERRIGRFEEADGGTLFLDEIGEIDPSTQVKLLRVLGEDRSFERLGSNKPIQVDVRLLSATNQNLRRMVDEGKFRLDLYHRLNVVEVHMPPLKERKEDLPILVDAFLKEFAEANGKPYRPIAAEAMDAILRFDWPGNVRELRSAIEHGVVMAQAPEIRLRDMPLYLRDPAHRSPSGPAPVSESSPVSAPRNNLSLEQTERDLILQALRECGNNRTEAARRLGISRRTLHRRLHDLQENGYTIP